MNQKSVSEMKFFTNNHIKRKTAWVMLMLWLLALTSGVANACLLDANHSTSRGATAQSAKDGHAPAALQVETPLPSSHGDDTNASKVPCLKVCDDASQALQKKYAESDLTDRGPAFLVATLWGVAMPVVPTMIPTDDLPPLPVGPSLQIRYSRWAL